MSEKTIYLTFDDGPSEPHTSEVLALLEQYGAKATFFVCGKNIERSPESIQRIVAAGHAIGNHTHFHQPWHTVTGAVVSEVEQTAALIKRYTDVDTRLFRFPNGISTPWARNRILKLGYTIYHWNIMAFDWWQPKSEVVAEHVLKRAEVGSIILLHDGDEVYEKPRSRAETVRAVSIILPELVRQGYVFKALDGVYNNRKYTFKNWTIDNWWWLRQKFI